MLKLIRKRAKRAIIVSQKARHIARPARILHCAKTLVQDDNQSCVSSSAGSCLRPIFGFIFVERARVNVRAKERAVNSVFLVQLRKIVATDFRGSARIKDLVSDVSLSRVEGLGSAGGRVPVRNFLRAGKLIVHRGCTGNAESGGQ
jgi:hypothetical protein